MRSALGVITEDIPEPFLCSVILMRLKPLRAVYKLVRDYETGDGEGLALAKKYPSLLRGGEQKRGHFSLI
jgi:hypothetical protein